MGCYFGVRIYLFDDDSEVEISRFDGYEESDDFCIFFFSLVCLKVWRDSIRYSLFVDDIDVDFWIFVGYVESDDFFFFFFFFGLFKGVERFDSIFIIM